MVFRDSADGWETPAYGISIQKASLIYFSSFFSLLVTYPHFAYETLNVHSAFWYYFVCSFK